MTPDPELSRGLSRLSRRLDHESSARGRAARWLKNARVTASVAANVANPLAVPIADSAASDLPRSTPDAALTSRDQAKKDWARYERVRRERSPAGPHPVPVDGNRRRERG